MSEAVSPAITSIDFLDKKNIAITFRSDKDILLLPYPTPQPLKSISIFLVGMEGSVRYKHMNSRAMETHEQGAKAGGQHLE